MSLRETHKIVRYIFLNTIIPRKFHMTSLQWNKLMHHSLSNFHQYFRQAIRKPNKTFNTFQVLLMCGLFFGWF